MNKEETIETLKTMKENIDKKYLKTRNSVAIETVLNLLEKKDRQLEERTNRIRNLEKECQSNFDNMMDTIQDNSKKDKMIDEMAETLRYYNGMQQEQCFCIDICGEKECDMKNCKERIKQYVEYKVEEDK